MAVRQRPLRVEETIMSGGAQAAMLPDGRRLHLQHGPIDLIIEAFAEPAEVNAAYQQAWDAFQPVLSGLVDELPILRSPIGSKPMALSSPVAARMVASCRPFAPLFITPMAAVAGAVADFILSRMTEGRRLHRAYVNNGGDIALFLSPGTRFQAGIVSRLDQPRIESVAQIDASTPVRGIATSGRGGRSLSMGIADAVTVLARTAAEADAAATLISNAVDVESATISRAPANTVVEDSDLGARPVVVSVGQLTAVEVETALANGESFAQNMLRHERIEAAYLSLAGRHRVVGNPVPVLTQSMHASAA